MKTTVLIDTLVKCFVKVTDLDPFPVGHLNTTYETAKGIDFKNQSLINSWILFSF